MKDGFRHHISLAWVNAVMRGGLYCMSMYLRHSEGLSSANMLILEEAAVALGTVSGPWVIGGDWNMPPHTLAASGWLDMVGGLVVATTLPTCNESVYDYFVVQRSIAHAVVGVQPLSDGGLNPHWPTRLVASWPGKELALRRARMKQ